MPKATPPPCDPQSCRDTPAGTSLPGTGKNIIYSKTELCKFYARGRCRNGPTCAFAHGAGELRSRPDLFKTIMCPAVRQRQECPRGSVCTYAHHAGELRQGPVPKATGAEPFQQPDYTEGCAEMIRALNVELASLREQVRLLRLAGADLSLGISGEGAPSGGQQRQGEGGIACGEDMAGTPGSRHEAITSVGIPCSSSEAASWAAGAGGAVVDEPGEGLGMEFEVTVVKTFIHVVPRMRGAAHRRSRSSQI